MKNKVLILGAGGFIGNHLAKRLKSEGHTILGIDLKHPEFNESPCDSFIIGDLRDSAFCEKYITGEFHEVYQLAADMGGAGYIFSGENDFNVMHNSALININVTRLAVERKIQKIFYSSSACIYPKRNQEDPENPQCSEETAYPADPDSEYGWEKLFSERLFLSAARNFNLNVRIARFHNVYGTHGIWNNGKEKAPAALCRKVAEAKNNGHIEIWGSGNQTRSFLYIDDCLNGIRQLMDSDFRDPINIGSEELISINDFARMIIGISKKNLSIKNIDGPVGVNGRTSNNQLAEKHLSWKPNFTLAEGITHTYQWINSQMKVSEKSAI